MNHTASYGCFIRGCTWAFIGSNPGAIHASHALLALNGQFFFTLFLSFFLASFLAPYHSRVCFAPLRASRVKFYINDSKIWILKWLEPVPGKFFGQGLVKILMFLNPASYILTFSSFSLFIWGMFYRLL